jgi:tripartite-type tricarboxylate transporter receptor subunit TctC
MSKLHRLMLKTVAALLALNTIAAAQDYPSKPVRLIIPFPPGGINDTVGRLVATQLSTRLGKQFVVDNRGGAGGTVGTELTANAPKDGYTLLVISLAHAVNPWLYKLPYDPIKAFAPVAIVASAPNVITVHPSLPVHSVKELLALAKEKPGQVQYASAGVGSFMHLGGELFKLSAGVNLLHVPFRGAGPALAALLGGTVQAVASAPGTLKQQVDDGKMRVLANWGAERVKSFPDLPTFRELGYKDVEFYIWAGLFAQAALPASIMMQLREATAQAVSAPEVIRTFETAGSPVAYQDAPEFSKFVAEDSARLVASVKKIGKVE